CRSISRPRCATRAAGRALVSRCRILTSTPDGAAGSRSKSQITRWMNSSSTPENPSRRSCSRYSTSRLSGRTAANTRTRSADRRPGDDQIPDRRRASGSRRGRCAASRAHENRGRPGISPSWERQTAREYRTYTPAMHRLARALDRQRGRAMTDAEKKQSSGRSRRRRLWRRLQKLLEQFPEAVDEVFGLKQPFDSNTRPFDIFEYSGPGDRIKTMELFATKENALAFV